MDTKDSVYRQIRYDRTYRTLGRMNWIRVVLGAVLLISIFFISGTVSEYFASRGSYALAEKMMLAPAWMEKYKPETKAYLEAGALYEGGDYDGAYDAAVSVDTGELSDSKKTVYSAICTALYEHFDAAGDTGRTEELSERIRQCDVSNAE